MGSHANTTQLEQELIALKLDYDVLQQRYVALERLVKDKTNPSPSHATAHDWDEAACQGQTERQRFRARLEGQLFFQEQLLNSISVPIFFKDCEGRYLGGNVAFEKFIGVPLMDLVGKSVFDVSPVELAKTYLSKDKELFDSPGTQVYESCVKSASGEQRNVMFHKATFRQIDGTLGGLVGVILDITDQRRSETALEEVHAQLEERFKQRTQELEGQRQQLIQAEKLASVGTLVAGVAHEINNPNHFILLNASILQRVFEGIMPLIDSQLDSVVDGASERDHLFELRHQIPELIQGMLDGSQRIKRIVSDLRDYARPDLNAAKEALDVNDIVSAAVSLIKSIIGRSAHHLCLELGQGIPAIYGSKHRLEQVIVNLLTNASQALASKDGGIDLFTRYDASRKMVVVEVCDEGTGISPENLSRLGDPFFTTKRAHGGMGLGLSVSLGIMRDHEGLLEFESTVGKGTTARMLLPPAPQPPRSGEG